MGDPNHAAPTRSYLGAALDALVDRLRSRFDASAIDDLSDTTRHSLADICEAYRGIVPDCFANDTGDTRTAVLVQRAAREMLGSIHAAMLVSEAQPQRGPMPEAHQAALVAEVRLWAAGGAVAMKEAMDVTVTREPAEWPIAIRMRLSFVATLGEWGQKPHAWLRHWEWANDGCETAAIVQDDGKWHAWGPWSAEDCGEGKAADVEAAKAEATAWLAEYVRRMGAGMEAER